MTARSNSLRPSTNYERNLYGLEAAQRERELSAVVAVTRDWPPPEQPVYELLPGDNPASTCPSCLADGAVDHNQTKTHSGRKRLRGCLRFSCPCGARWTVDTRAAVEHGQFLARQRAQP